MSDIEPIEIMIQNADPEKMSPKEAFEDMNENLEWILKNMVISAKIRRASFDAHVAEGFTVEQALFLIK